MTPLERINRIKEKFKVLNIDYTKAFNPPLKELEILAFEKTHEISLPEDYRLFLKEVGDGINYKEWSLLRDSSLEILPLHETIYEKSQLSAPFPYTIEKPDRNDYLNPHPDGFINDGFNDLIYDGYLNVSDFGCGIYICLIVSGEAFGQVWIYGDLGVFVSLGDASWEDWSEGKRPCTFLEWFEGWLDHDYGSRYGDAFPLKNIA